MRGLSSVDHPLHVLMTADAVGGMFTYALDLADGLSRRGARVTLALLGPEASARQREAAGAIRALDVVETGLPLDWTARDQRDFAAAAEGLARLVTRVAPDILHLNSPAFAAEMRFGVPVVGACHSCLATWWEGVRSGPAPDDFRWRTEHLRAGYVACDALVAPSRSFAEATARAYAIPAPLVVRNGRRPAFFQAARRSERLVFTAGRLWDEGKDLVSLDQAAAQIDAPVYAAGPVGGPGGEAVHLRHAHAVGELGAAAIAAWLRRAEVFVSTAVYEPFGLAVLEAAQAGTALVLTDIPTFRELWDGAAVFAPARQPDAIAKAVNGLLADGDARARMAAAARERAARYGVEAMTAAMMDLYMRLVSGAGAGAAAAEAEAAA